MRTTHLLAALALAGGAHTEHTTVHTRAAEDLLARSAAMYAALQSYADVGTFTDERNGSTDHYKFRTYFRRPTHDLFFDWQGISSYTEAAHYTLDLSGIRLVFWMVQSDLQTYDAGTRSLDHYPPGSNQASALNQATYNTRGVSTLIPSMLYAKTGLLSMLRELREVSDDGMEDVGGHQCHRLVGVAADQYAATGRIVNVRPVKVWIDAKSLLIRKTFEGTPKGSSIDSYRRRTIDFQPEANPRLDDSKFQFTVPSSQP